MVAKRTKKSRQAKQTKRAVQTGNIEAHKSFHALVVLWNEHIKREMALHHTFKKGSKGLAVYLKQTLALTKSFEKKVAALSKKAKR